MELRVFTCICLFLLASTFAGVLYQAGDVSADETVTRLDVEPDGDATFVLEIRTNLDTDAERASFESFEESWLVRDGFAKTDGVDHRNGPEYRAGASTGGVLTSLDGDADTKEGVPLYFYAVAVVFVISAAALAYRTRTDTEESTATGGRGTGTHQEGQESPEETEHRTEAEAEVVSDDERVLRMIETEGGRMKQKHLVEETGWSEAKVSKLTSSMEEKGEITKIRLGRENILEIQDEDEEEGEDEFGY